MVVLEPNLKEHQKVEVLHGGTGIFQARLVGNNFKYFHLGTERKGQ